MDEFIEVHLHNVYTGKSYAVVINDMADIIYVPSEMFQTDIGIQLGTFEAEAHHLAKYIQKFKGMLLYKTIKREFLPDNKVWEGPELLKASLKYE